MDIAQAKWEFENDVEEVNAVFAYDGDAQKAEVMLKPWKDNPNYFTRVKVSAVALIKMVTHTTSGGNIEVMGLMMGKISGSTMWVMDSFALPVEGTETRVNAQQEGYEYMVNFITQAKESGRHENIIGWYHSHPGYGCWLSGIDVATQALNQQFQEPFVALVIDPIRTASAGKVEIGAFRTYPEEYVQNNQVSTQSASIPSEKVEDFGVYCKKYYQLSIEYFKSKKDAELLRQLWQKYWARTLSKSRFVANRVETNSAHSNKMIEDLSNKLCLHQPSGKNDVGLQKLANQGQQIAIENASELVLNMAREQLKFLK